MKIPSSNRIKNSFPLSPKNDGRSVRVQQELDWVLSRANKQYLEAIAVDGFEINHWRRCLEGNRCTCQFNNTEIPSKLAPVTIEPGSYLSFTISPNHKEFESPNSTKKVLDFEFGKLPEEEDTDETMKNLRDEDILDEILDDAVLKSPDSGILFGGDKSPCGICFGTGHVNGYSLSNGKRDILDLSNTYEVRLYGCEINTNTLPHSIDFSLDDKTYAEWIVPVSYYFHNCVSINCFNNTELTNHFNIMVSFDNINWQPASVDLLNTRKQINTVMSVRAYPKYNNLEKTIKLTHIEIVWQYSKWPKAQMSQISQATNYGIFDSVITAEFTFPPTLNLVTKEDAFWESKHNKLWKITDVTDFKTANNNVMGWTVQARVIQEYEQLNILRTYRDIKENISHATLENFMGSREKSPDKKIK